MGSSRQPPAVVGTRLRWAVCREDEATREATSEPLCCRAGRPAAFLRSRAGLPIAESPAAGAAGQTRAAPPFLVLDVASNRRRHACSSLSPRWRTHLSLSHWPSSLSLRRQHLSLPLSATRWARSSDSGASPSLRHVAPSPVVLPAARVPSLPPARISSLPPSGPWRCAGPRSRAAAQPTPPLLPLLWRGVWPVAPSSSRRHGAAPPVAARVPSLPSARKAKIWAAARPPTPSSLSSSTARGPLVLLVVHLLSLPLARGAQIWTATRSPASSASPPPSPPARPLGPLVLPAPSWGSAPSSRWS
ncbi:uncharacterized protein [Miscanthus floridulus]|uniref:uncharacterized protein n=1 Tax=Miscanthus floridulus TaxID=154761 RepID=UPI003457D770